MTSDYTLFGLTFLRLCVVTAAALSGAVRAPAVAATLPLSTRDSVA
jgi:hypothetical protein